MLSEFPAGFVAISWLLVGGGWSSRLSWLLLEILQQLIVLMNIIKGIGIANNLVVAIMLAAPVLSYVIRLQA